MSLSTLRATLNDLGGLRVRDVWWMAQILGMLAVFPVLNRLLALPKLVSLFDTEPGPTKAGVADRDRLLRLMGGLLRRTLERDYCLPRSLILFRFYRKWGFPTRIHMGLAKQGDHAVGHAWISLAGEPFAEQKNPEDLFVPFFAYPQTEAA